MSWDSLLLVVTHFQLVRNFLVMVVRCFRLFGLQFFGCLSLSTLDLFSVLIAL